MNNDLVRFLRIADWLTARAATLPNAGPEELQAAEALGPLDPSEPEVLERVEGERPGVWIAVPGGWVFAPSTERASDGELEEAFRRMAPTELGGLDEYKPALRLIYDMGRRRGRGEDKAATELRAEYEASARERAIRECAALFGGLIGDEILEKMGLEP